MNVKRIKKLLSSEKIEYSSLGVLILPPERVQVMMAISVFLVWEQGRVRGAAGAWMEL